MHNFRTGDAGENVTPKTPNYASLSSIVDKVVRRLGDSDNEIWERSELETYAQLGYEQFVTETNALWDTRHLPDRHSPAYTTDEPSNTNTESKRIWPSAIQSFGDSESSGGVSPSLDLVCVSDATPFIGNSKQDSDFDGLTSFITSPADVPYTTAATQQDYLMPDDVLMIDRATWDGIQLQALTPKEADQIDDLWEEKTGDPRAFVIVGKGRKRIFRKLRTPSAPADMRAFSNEVGFIRGGFHEPELATEIVSAPSRITLTPFAIFDSDGTPTSLVSTVYPYPVLSLVVITIYTQKPIYGWPALDETSEHVVIGGPFGLPRRIDGVWFTNAPFGFPKRFSGGNRNTKIDYVKKPRDLKKHSFEIQPWDVRYIVFFMLSRALDRDGPGQNKKLAEHYLQRYQNGIESVKLRNANANDGARHVMGVGTIDISTETAKLPANYDARDR